MPTYDAILAQDTQFLTVPVEVSRATHFPLILAPNITIPTTAFVRLQTSGCIYITRLFCIVISHI